MHNMFLKILNVAFIASRDHYGSKDVYASNDQLSLPSVTRKIDRHELKYISLFAIKTNSVLFVVFLASMYACHSSPYCELILLLIWVPYVIVYIATFLFKLIFSFSKGKWLFLFCNFFTAVLMCFAISFAVGDGTGSHGGIASNGLAIGLAGAILIVITPIVIWLEVKG